MKLSLFPIVFVNALAVNAYIDLKSAGSFGVLASAPVISTGLTVIIGDLGTTGTSITGFPPGIYTGQRFIGTTASAARADAIAAYNAFSTVTILLNANLGGRVLAPGNYRFASGAQITGTLTLVGTGSPTDAWYFQTGSTLVTSVGATVILTGGAKPCNIFWRVGTSATIGVGTQMSGTILAAISITVNAAGTLNGGVFALSGNVVTNSARITAQYCPAIVPPSSSSSTSLPASSTTSTLSSESSSSTSSLVSSSSSASPTTTSTSETSLSTTTSADVSSSSDVSSAVTSSTTVSSSLESTSSSTSSSSIAPSTSSSDTTTSTSSLITTTTTTSSTTSPTPSSIWQYSGCYTETKPERALTGAVLASDQLTIERCATFCSAFSYFGVEYGRECYCSNVLKQDSLAVAEEECNFKCAGSSTETCGAGDRLNVYKNPSAPTPSTTTSATPLPTSYRTLGCYSDTTDSRALNQKFSTDDAMTIQKCAANCAGYKYFGLEYYFECFCGNELQASSVEVATTECTFPCSGDETQICGANNRLNLYGFGDVPAPPTPVSSSTTTTTASPSATAYPGYTTTGCYTDSTSNRALSEGRFYDDNMTVGMCALACSGYSLFGVEYGRECYCGATLNSESVLAPTEECNFACPGNKAQFCGAGDRLNVYRYGPPVVVVVAPI